VPLHRQVAIDGVREPKSGESQMKRVPILRRIATPLLIVIAVLGLATAAGAHKKTYSTTVTAAAHNKNQVEGAVLSPNVKCLPSRVVSIYSPTGVLEASTSTDAAGKYQVTSKALVTGSHVVKAAKRVILKTKRHAHRCSSAETTFVVS
jgi:hypothetical protein